MQVAAEDKKLNLMYITNDPEVALMAEDAGVGRIFVDFESIGKKERQKGLDTVQSTHTMDDLRRIRGVIKKAEILVRCNPIHEASETYSSSKEEIDEIVEKGADIIMLPFFKTVEEVESFIEYVGGRAKTQLLVETIEAEKNIKDILNVQGIDEVYIGLNDLSLAYGKGFMFELLCDGTVEGLCTVFKEKGVPFGFGGIAAPGGKGQLPAEYIIAEHYHLGSEMVILSRSFCDMSKHKVDDDLKALFKNGINQIRLLEDALLKKDKAFFTSNQRELRNRIEIIVKDDQSI